MLCLLLLPAERLSPAVFTLSHPEEGCIKNLDWSRGCLAVWDSKTSRPRLPVWRQHRSRGWCAGTPGRAEAGEMAALLCASVMLRGIHENESSLTVWAAQPFFFFLWGSLAYAVPILKIYFRWQAGCTNSVRATGQSCFFSLRRTELVHQSTAGCTLCWFNMHIMHQHCQERRMLKKRRPELWKDPCDIITDSSQPVLALLVCGQPILKLCLDLEVFWLQGCCKCHVLVKQTDVHQILLPSKVEEDQRQCSIWNLLPLPCTQSFRLRTSKFFLVFAREGCWALKCNCAGGFNLWRGYTNMTYEGAILTWALSKQQHWKKQSHFEQ